MSERTSATPSRRHLLLFFLVVLTLKLGFLAAAHDNPFVRALTNDEAYWISEATDILDHGVIRDDAFWGAPAYPYLLALVFAAFGPGLWPVLLLQALMDACNVVLVVLLAARTTGSRRAAWLAGGLILLYGPFWMYETLVLKSTLTVLATDLALLALVVALDRSQRSWWFAAGVAFGVLPLLRGDALLVLPFVFLGLILEVGRRRTDAARLGVWLLGVACGVLPATVHNTIAAADFVPTTYQGGTMFFIGNRRGGDGSYASLRPGRGHPEQEQYDAVTIAEAAVGRPLWPSEISAFWLRMGLAEIAADPAGWARLMVRKIRLFHTDAENTDVVDFRVYREVQPHLWLVPLSFGVLLALAVPGLVIGRRLADARLLVLVMLGSIVSVTTFFVFARYRLPAVTPYALFAAVTVDSMFDWIRARRWRPVAATLVAAGTVFGLARIPAPGSGPAMGYNTLGSLYARLGDLANARLYLERVVRELPDRGDMRYNLGNILLRQGEMCAAGEQYRIAARDPTLERVSRTDPIVRLQLYEIAAAWVTATEGCPDMAPLLAQTIDLRRQRARAVLLDARAGVISVEAAVIQRLETEAADSVRPP